MSLFYFNFDREVGKRYQVSRFMRFERGVYDFSTSYFLQEFMKLSPEGAYTILSVPQRPDVYSRDITGTLITGFCCCTTTTLRFSTNWNWELH